MNRRQAILAAVGAALAAPAAAKSAPPPTQAVYIGGTVQVPSGGAAHLPWRFNSGTQLLDLTDPANPKVKAAGTYTFNATVQLADTPEAGASAVAQIESFDPLGASINGSLDLALPGSQVPLTLAWYMAAGTALDVQVVNRATVAKTFALTVCVTKP